MKESVAMGYVRRLRMELQVGGSRDGRGVAFSGASVGGMFFSA
jgi:hypothetical protein